RTGQPATHRARLHPAPGLPRRVRRFQRPGALAALQHGGVRRLNDEGPPKRALAGMTSVWRRYGVPKGIRTPVVAVKGRCPRPLDDGDADFPIHRDGGARRDRTADLLHAMQALSQLSYGPTMPESRQV